MMAVMAHLTGIGWIDFNQRNPCLNSLVFKELSQLIKSL